MSKALSPCPGSYEGQPGKGEAENPSVPSLETLGIQGRKDSVTF
jgi:hypothetical protein